MNIPQILASSPRTAFSFEVLPPLKGTGIGALKNTIDRLAEFAPQYINITTHRSEYVYREVGDGLMQRQSVRRRPGTIAVAAAIQNEYHIPVVPHVLCAAFSKEDIEYMLLDLQFLGISNILLLRGDKAREESYFKPSAGGYTHTTELQEQVNQFNRGFFADGTPIKVPGTAFDYGVACYPEKHEEALNLSTDFQYFRQKVENGASYGVTQLFYDNEAYFRFVEHARAEGIAVPIIPGIKPFAKLSQLQTVPKTFHCNFPEALAREAVKCRTDEEAKALGVEWGIAQCRELMAHGVPSIHFYTVSAVDSIAQIARAIY
jgi:methylenetetrahydrofolate reductase (NADPH)